MAFKMRREKKVPMVCIEDSCMRKGIQVFNGGSQCLECGGGLFPIEVLTKQDSDDDIDRMFEQMGEQKMLPGVEAHYTVREPEKKDTFTCPSDLTGCPVAKKSVVRIPIAMFNRWIFLAGQIDTEWIAYLKGVETAPGTYEITSMYFPEQKATSTHCDAEDGEIEEGTIGAVHSHVGMKAFFSGEDEKHFNHKIEIVVNRDGDILANGRTQLECGRFHRGLADILFVGCEEELDLVEKLKSKLRRDTTQFQAKPVVIRTITSK